MMRRHGVQAVRLAQCGCCRRLPAAGARRTYPMKDRVRRSRQVPTGPTGSLLPPTPVSPETNAAVSSRRTRGGSIDVSLLIRRWNTPVAACRHRSSSSAIRPSLHRVSRRPAAAARLRRPSSGALSALHLRGQPAAGRTPACTAALARTTALSPSVRRSAARRHDPSRAACRPGRVHTTPAIRRSNRRLAGQPCSRPRRSHARRPRHRARGRTAGSRRRIAARRTHSRRIAAPPRADTRGSGNVSGPRRRPQSGTCPAHGMLSASRRAGRTGACSYSSPAARSIGFGRLHGLLPARARPLKWDGTAPDGRRGRTAVDSRIPRMVDADGPPP